jgi:hypothetical protein
MIVPIAAHLGSACPGLTVRRDSQFPKPLISCATQAADKLARNVL